jgi:hypothetical protein
MIRAELVSVSACAHPNKAYRRILEDSPLNANVVGEAIPMRWPFFFCIPFLLLPTWVAISNKSPYRRWILLCNVLIIVSMFTFAHFALTDTFGVMRSIVAATKLAAIIIPMHLILWLASLGVALKTQGGHS